MRKNSSESSAPTVRPLKQQHNSMANKPDSEGKGINAIAILDFRVRLADGRLTKFDIFKVTDDLELSMTAIGRELNDQNQGLVYDLSGQVIQALLADKQQVDVIEADDVHLQVEMTLMLNKQIELAKAYLQRQVLR
jgi:hypothetical protein